MGLGRYRITGDDWDYFKEIHFFFESFNFYTAEINQLIDKEIDLAKEIYNKFTKELEVNPTWEDEEFDYFSNVQAKMELTDIYYDSLIMALYSFLEKKMLYLCKYLSSEHEIKVNDIAGKGIFKYQKYLSKVCSIDFSPIDAEWKTLLGYNNLRNHIVHSEGNRHIPKTKNELINFLKMTNGVTFVDEEKSIMFHFSTDDILINFVSVAKTIIDHIYIEQI